MEAKTVASHAFSSLLITVLLLQAIPGSISKSSKPKQGTWDQAIEAASNALDDAKGASKALNGTISRAPDKGDVHVVRNDIIPRINEASKYLNTTLTLLRGRRTEDVQNIKDSAKNATASVENAKGKATKIRNSALKKPTMDAIGRVGNSTGKLVEIVNKIPVKS